MKRYPGYRPPQPRLPDQWEPRRIQGVGPAVERKPRGCLKRAPHSTMPKQTSMEAFFCEPTLGVEGRHASGTRSCNGLTVGFVARVTTPENAIDIRVG